MTDAPTIELPHFDAPIRAVHGPSPLRVPGSVRRTTTLDAVWPQGRGGVTEIFGMGRDLLTPLAGSPSILSDTDIHVLTDHRVIKSISSKPERQGLSGLSGAHAGRHLRAAIDEVLPGERAAGSLLYLLLDDLAGTTLVAGWAFGRWPEIMANESDPRPAKPMAGVCIGFRPGSGALNAEGFPRGNANCTPVPPLAAAEDPLGWHELPDREGVNFRRARRIDVWPDAAGGLRIDAGFQDSASLPQGGRMGIHEYRLQAQADADGRLQSVTAMPGTLPFAECRAAPSNLTALVGVPLADLREEVISRLRATAGCTHLNDMLRALAEVPMLAAMLD